jgi:hypothetical protein
LHDSLELFGAMLWFRVVQKFSPNKKAILLQSFKHK